MKNVDTLGEIKEKVFKVTLFSYKGEASKMYNAFAERWGDKYDVAVWILQLIIKALDSVKCASFWE